jgi:PAS domain S-box-containing protein
MGSTRRNTFGVVPLRAVTLSALALGVPLVATIAPVDLLGRQGPLLWLLALVPAFLLAYYRGWRGASVALGAGMAALAVGHGVAVVLGHALPDGPLLAAVTGAVLISVVGIGWTTELLHRRFRAVEEQSSEITLVVDDAGVLRYGSLSVRGMLGLNGTALEGRRLTELLEAGAPAPSLAAAARVGAGVVSLALQSADGGVRILEAVVKRRAGMRGVEYVLHGRDVTDRVRSEEQHRRIYRMQAISRLAQALAHDFNNVLTTIRGHVHLLEDEVRGVSSAERGLAEILEASERASNFVELLLAFTRQQALRPRSVDLNKLLVETRPRLQELLGTRAPVGLERGADLPHVFMDPSQLRRILLILASRAAERMPDGGRFTLTTLREEITEEAALRYPYPVLPGEYVVLSVTDSGPVLGPEEQARIFEPFSGGVGEESTGLELSSVYGTVKQSGGYVWVASEEGVGTTFRVFLPLASSGAGESLAEEPVDTSERGMVLVAEDDVHVRAVVCRVLLREGYYVLEAADGEDALRLAEHLGDRLDLVVTDLMMPRMGGRELANALRASRPALPILFMSGQPDEVPAEMGADAGEAFIMKPFSPNELASQLRTLSAGSVA